MVHCTEGVNITGLIFMKKYRTAQILGAGCRSNALSSYAPKHGDINYELVYKFGFIYKDIIHNDNAIKKWADLGQSGDETTWGHGVSGEK